MNTFVLLLVSVNLAINAYCGNSTSNDSEKLKDVLRNNRTSRSKNDTEDGKNVLQTQASSKLRECGVQPNDDNDNYDGNASSNSNFNEYGNTYGSRNSNSNSQNRYGSSQSNNRPQRNYNGDNVGNNFQNEENRRNSNQEGNRHYYESSSDRGDDSGDRYSNSRRNSYENSHFGGGSTQKANYSKLHPYSTNPYQSNSRGTDIDNDDHSNQNRNNDRGNNRYNGNGSWGYSSEGGRTNYGYRHSGNSGIQNNDRDENFRFGYNNGGSNYATSQNPFKNQWYGSNGNRAGGNSGGNSGTNYNFNPYGDDCDEDGQNRENNGGYGYLHHRHMPPVMKNLLKGTRKKRYSFGIHKTNKSNNNDQCISQCVFAHLQILDDYRSPSETMFVKWIQDHYKESDAERVDTLRHVRRCFARLTSTDIEDGCEFSSRLSECLNLSLEI
ncbi:GATA zinc finger domain-containing protein 14-like [Cylas formicarius]|uniref:GATA zinc finger domain-containing protein 14-like n=1 Tax=Cylas formicarius TaxID=197179 RepID=UPI00295888C0|nr:GATA zinc finger domain-containing protein 14-like [Cylas formicarius]